MRAISASIAFFSLLLCTSLCAAPEVEERHRILVLTIDQLQSYGVDLPAEFADYETLKRTKLPFGPVTIEYEFSGPDALGLPYLSSMVERHRSAGGACGSYALGTAAVRLFADELAVKDDVFQAGSKSTFGLLMNDGLPSGNYFAMCHGKFMVEVVLAGVYIDDGEVWRELLAPSLRALELLSE